MMLQTRILRPAATAIAALALSACSLVGPRPEMPVQAPVPAAAPEMPPPVLTQRFEIDPSEDVVGVVQVTTAGAEDTLSDIARRFNVGYEEIVRANPKVDPWLPGEGREVVVPTRFVLPDAPRRGIVVNVAAMRLYYFPTPRKGEKKQVVYTYPIGIGKVGWATPHGVTRITRRQKDPIWRPTPSIIREHRKNGEDLPAVVQAGPDNPLGRHAFYLGWPSYLIHGTNKPAGVGLRSSHGCMRLYPEDIAALFEAAPVGTEVRVVNQPFLFGWHGDELYLQAYDVLEDDPRDWKKAQQKLLARSVPAAIQKRLRERGETIQWDRVTRVAEDPHGIPVLVTGTGETMEQVVAAAPRVQNRVPDGSNWDGISDLPGEEGESPLVSGSDARPTPTSSRSQPVIAVGPGPRS